jgi:hypothetical protein
MEELLPSLEGQMKAEGSFQILTMSWEILFQIPEDSNLLGYHCRNLKYHFNFMSSGRELLVNSVIINTNMMTVRIYEAGTRVEQFNIQSQNV